MTEKHLIYYIWKHLDEDTVKDMINCAEEFNWSFSEKRAEGEISVADALRESYKTFEGIKK